MKRREFLSNSALASTGALMSLNNKSYLSILGKDSFTSEDSLFDNFTKPPTTSKPFFRWWWNGDLIEKSEIIRQLDTLKEAGIGGVEINPIRFPGKDDLGIKSLEWLSDDWIDMVLFTVDEAKKRDILCDLIVGSGWPFGGEFLEQEEQGQVLVMNVDNSRLTNYRMVGPARVSFSKDDLLNSIRGYDKGKKELFSVRMIPFEMDEFEPGRELINEFKDGFVDIEVPYYGEYSLCVVVKVTGQQSVTRGAPGASGPVLNHFNKNAVSKYLNRISDAFHGKSKDMGDLFRAMFCDSLELDGNTWCIDFYEEFEKRRGYSLEPFLPYVLSYTGKEPFDTKYMGGDGAPLGPKLSKSILKEISRVRYDYTITKQELFDERFYDTLLKWCKDNGVKARVQPYGIGYHPLEASLKVDIPECETWLGDHIGLKDHPGYTSANKFVSSAAHLAGKKIISCEEITNISLVFFASLEDIKITGDQSNLSGVNHSVLHGYNYSPERTEFPGWIQFGTYFNERNTWWPFFHKWTSYKARLSSIFQLSEPGSDIGLLLPLADKWSWYGQQFQPAFGWGARYPWYEYELWAAIHQNGNSCDYLSDGIISKCQVKDGKLRFNNCSFHTIILMEVNSISLESCRVISKFIKEGGKVVFVKHYPKESLGMKKTLKDDDKIKTIFEDVISNHPNNCKVVSAPEKDLLKWYAELQSEFGIIPQVKISKPNKNVSQIHYRYNEKEIFFFVNSNRNETYNLNANFNVDNDLNPWIWDPNTGKRYRYPHNGRKNDLTIKLGPAESKLIIYDTKKRGESFLDYDSKGYEELELGGEWNVSLNHINGEKKVVGNMELKKLSEIEEIKGFAGTISYIKKFHSDTRNKFGLLYLGKVNDGISEVFINGKRVGDSWYGNHIYQIENLKRGENQIEIKITTIIGNYCKSLEENPTCQQWTKSLPYTSMGMEGPVRVLQKI